MTSTNDELQSQLNALKVRIKALEDQATQPGEFRCTKLEVVNNAQEVVATIRNDGIVFGHGLNIENSTGWNSLRYNADFAKLEIRSGTQPAVVLNESGLGGIRLDCGHPGFRSFVELGPEPDGGRLLLGDKDGKTVFDASTGSAGMSVYLRSHDPEQGEVSLGVDNSGNGQLVIRDARGVIRTTLP